MLRYVTIGANLQASVPNPRPITDDCKVNSSPCRDHLHLVMKFLLHTVTCFVVVKFWARVALVEEGTLKLPDLGHRWHQSPWGL